MRFHCGISFSWRTIKKFLIPFIIGLLAFFGFSGITNDSALGFIKVNALVDDNSTFNVDIPDYDSNLESYSCGTENVKDFLHNFLNTTDFSSTYYDLFIDNNFESQIVFYLIPKNNDNINNFLVYRGSENAFSLNYTYRYWNDNYSNARWYYLFYKSCTGDISSSNSWNTFLNALNTGSIGSTTADGVGQFSSNSSNSIPYFGGYETITSRIYQGSNYDVSLWYYFSSRQLQYNATTSTLNQNGLLFKKLHLVDNDTTYNIGDEIPSYYDIYNNSNPNSSTFIEYKSKLGTIYTNFIPSQVSNFSLNIKFDTEDITGYDYFHNLEYFWNCYGRVNHNNNYYTYEKFSYCSFEQWDNSSSVSNKFDVTFNNLEIYDQQDNKITNFSNYDKLFFYLDFQYKDSSLNQTLSSINISFNGNIHLDDRFSGVIYENFDSLTLYSKIFLSTTKNDYSYFEARYSGTTFTDRYFLYKQQFDTSSLVGIGEVSFLGTTFQRLSVNKAYNLGYLIFQQLSTNNSGLDLPKVDLIIFDDIVISINNINSNNIYYVDSNGNVTNGDISIQYDNISDNSYDLEYYFRIVYDYIDSYKDKIWDLHLTIQNFYDSTPALLQNTIYVLFILLCITFIYKEIRR